MAISYHVYANDGCGGTIDYSTVVATVPASAANPVGLFTTGPLAAPSDNLFGVRAFNDVSGVEEANTDARVRIVIDGQGRDVSSQPNAVLGLAARWAVGEVALVSWSYAPAGQGGAPTGFNITASPQATSAGVVTPALQSVAYIPGVAGYGCRLVGLAPASGWTIQVQAVGTSGAIVGPLTTVNLTQQSSVLAPVDGLLAIASA